MFAASKTVSARPYWHVDLKWIFGLLAFSALCIALFSYNLSNLTGRDKSIELSATIVASLFSKEGLDDTSGLEEFRQKAAATPGNTVAPIPQYPWLTISKEQAMTLDAKELRLAIFKQLTTPIYDKGISGAAAEISSDPAEQAKFTRDATLLGLFTKATHDLFHSLFVYSSIVAAVLMLGAIYFSAGLGRLITPAVLLLLASPLGALLGILLAVPKEEKNATLVNLPSNITTEIGSSLNHSYTTASLIGLSLLLIAGILALIRKSRGAKSKLQSPKTTGQA